jgi:hypothetical protein
MRKKARLAKAKRAFFSCATEAARASAVVILAIFAAQLLRATLDFEALIADHSAHAVLHRADSLFDAALGALSSLRGLLLRFAFELAGFAFCVHAIVADQLANAALDLATELFGGAFSTFAIVAHDVLLIQGRLFPSLS